MLSWVPLLSDVFYLAKVQIFKQITTNDAGYITVAGMCFTLQRYKFSSKSQPFTSYLCTCGRCVLPCKGTNFQANHNAIVTYNTLTNDVFYLAKVQIFKQITTNWLKNADGGLMCFTLHRYKFSSKSQLQFRLSVSVVGCVLPCKGTNFQANHNGMAAARHQSVMCFTLQRYKFSSKSQPVRVNIRKSNGCVLPCKGTIFTQITTRGFNTRKV